MSTLGVLVAGGRGRRLGLGVPKALATLDGRTFLERTLEALAGACDEVVVALPAGMELPLGGVRRVDDLAGASDEGGGDERGAGPLAGLLAGLASGPFERAVALGVDYPRMTSDVLAGLARLMREEAARTSIDGLVPRVDGRLQPLAAVYAPSALAPLRDYFDSGGRGLMGGIGRLALAIPDEPALRAAFGEGAPEAFANVNTPEALAALGGAR